MIIVIESDTFFDGYFDGVEQQVFIVEDTAEGVLLLWWQSGCIVGGETLAGYQYVETALTGPFLAEEDQLFLGRHIDGFHGLFVFLPVNVLGSLEGVAHLDGFPVGVLQVGIVDE